MDNQDFQLPRFSSEEMLHEKLIRFLPHVRKDIKRGENSQSFDADPFIIEKAQRMVEERFKDIHPKEIDLVMRCLYQNTPDKEFIVGYHGGDEDDRNAAVVACGFNGGGFQMGPMVARLCIKLILSQDVPEEDLMRMLEIEHEEGNNDYESKGKGFCFNNLLNDMQRKFDPSRPSLKLD